MEMRKWNVVDIYYNDKEEKKARAEALKWQKRGYDFNEYAGGNGTTCNEGFQLIKTTSIKES